MSNPSCFLSLLMLLRQADKQGKGVKLCEPHFQFTALRSWVAVWIGSSDCLPQVWASQCSKVWGSESPGKVMLSHAVLHPAKYFSNAESCHGACCHHTVLESFRACVSRKMMLVLALTSLWPFKAWCLPLQKNLSRAWLWNISLVQWFSHSIAIQSDFLPQTLSAPNPLRAGIFFAQSEPLVPYRAPKSLNEPQQEPPGVGSDVQSQVSWCRITPGSSFPVCHFSWGRCIISPWQMQRGRNTRLFAMQFIKTCFRGGLREHWLEMLIIISDNVLTCLLPYPAASGGARAGISVSSSRASLPPLLHHLSWAEHGASLLAHSGETFLPVEMQLVGGEGKGKQENKPFFFFLDLVVFLLGRGSNLASVETNDIARLPCCLLLLRQKKVSLFFPFCFRLLWTKRAWGF